MKTIRPLIIGCVLAFLATMAMAPACFSGELSPGAPSYASNGLDSPAPQPEGSEGNVSVKSPAVKPASDQAAAAQDENPQSPESTSTAQGGFLKRFVRANIDDFQKKDEEPSEEPAPPARRALPAPYQSPPFPSGEYQGYPLIGVPAGDTEYPLMKALNGGPCGDTLKNLKINIDGWVNASANWSNASNSNAPTSYWFVPNALELNQFVLRAQRTADTVQTDHVDWGFRSVLLYGQDYRYMVAGGWQPAATPPSKLAYAVRHLPRNALHQPNTRS